MVLFHCFFFLKINHKAIARFLRPFVSQHFCEVF